MNKPKAPEPINEPELYKKLKEYQKRGIHISDTQREFIKRYESGKGIIPTKIINPKTPT